MENINHWVFAFVVTVAVVGAAAEDNACADLGCAVEATCSNLYGKPTCACPWGFHDRYDDGTECLKSCRFDQAITPKQGRIEVAPFSEAACVFWDFEAPCDGTVDVWFPVFDVKANQENPVVTVGDVGLNGNEGLAYTQHRPLVLHPPFHITIDSKDDGLEGRWKGIVMEYTCTPLSPSLDLLSRRTDCDPGYTREGDECVDINECLVSNSGSGSGSMLGSGAGNSCSEDAICYNSPGSYECLCDAEFEGDGTECTPCEAGYRKFEVANTQCTAAAQSSVVFTFESEFVCDAQAIALIQKSLEDAFRARTGEQVSVVVTGCSTGRRSDASRALLATTASLDYVVYGFATPAAATAAKEEIEENPDVVVKYLPSTPAFSGIIVYFPSSRVSASAAPPPPPPTTPEPTENEDDKGGVAAAAIAGGLVAAFVVIVVVALKIYYTKKAQKVAPEDDEDVEEKPRTRHPKKFTVEGDNFGSSNRKLAWGENFGRVGTPDSTSPVEPLLPRQAKGKRNATLAPRPRRDEPRVLRDVEAGDMHLQDVDLERGGAEGPRIEVSKVFK